MSLSERAAEFNNRFKTEKANIYFVRKAYKLAKVKMKMIKHTKILTPAAELKQKTELEKLKTEL